VTEIWDSNDFHFLLHAIWILWDNAPCTYVCTCRPLCVTYARYPVVFYNKLSPLYKETHYISLHKLLHIHSWAHHRHYICSAVKAPLNKKATKDNTTITILNIIHRPLFLKTPTATQGFHPFTTEGCYRALLYPPSLPNTPFAECIWMYLYRLQINWEI
jgi:hypothetical protein